VAAAQIGGGFIVPRVGRLFRRRTTTLLFATAASAATLLLMGARPAILRGADLAHALGGLLPP